MIAVAVVPDHHTGVVTWQVPFDRIGKDRRPLPTGGAYFWAAHDGSCVLMAKRQSNVVWAVKHTHDGRLAGSGTIKALAELRSWFRAKGVGYSSWNDRAADLLQRIADAGGRVFLTSLWEAGETDSKKVANRLRPYQRYGWVERTYHRGAPTVEITDAGRAWLAEREG